ncbi:MAG: MATE family efflux transporter [Clostridia bacterium]|nr:MATE family efflux transporter [Clostridia bacterium]
MIRLKGKNAIDMTHGPLTGKILRFSLPLMAANLAQLLFNAADVVVVGRFAGHTSLAAVSSTSCVIFLFVNLLIGISVGVNVVIARYLGLGGREREISRALHTAVTVAIAGGLIFAAGSLLAVRPMLVMMSTPEDVLHLAEIYLKIYFLGTPFTMLYNYGTAALRAKGDTKNPLLFMLVSGTINIALNLIFVISLKMDVVGVGIATVISQIVSGMMTLVCLMHSDDAVRFEWKKLCMDWGSFWAMARIGIPSGVQACLFSLSNVVIQGAINSYGSVVIAGVGAAESIEGFLYTSMNSFHQACQTFVSQNLGAKAYNRVDKIVRTCLVCTLVLGIVQSVAVCIFSHPLIGIYNTDLNVIEAGALRLWIVALPYAVFGLADVLVGAIRGCGIPIVPMIINLLGTCVLRLIWVGLMDTSRTGVEIVYLSYPVTWIVILVAIGLFWMHLRRKGFDALKSIDGT